MDFNPEKQPKYNPETHAKELANRHYTVIPGAGHLIPMDTFMTIFGKKSQCFTPEAEEPVLGGFSALADPDSSHRPETRAHRDFALEFLLPFFGVFSALIGMPGATLQGLFDRVMVRQEGKTVCGESAHRDECKFALSSDRIFGGWWNTSDDDQYFHCVPGTALDTNQGNGFARISKAQAKQYEARKVTVTVPPGGILIFYENMVHFVANSKAKKATCRLFLGWRLTYSDKPMHPDTEKWIEDQDVPLLKSGQKPRIFPRLYLVNHSKVLQKKSRYFHPLLRIKHEYQSGTRRGEIIDIVNPHIPSLKDLEAKFPGSFRRYPEYTRKQKKFFIGTKLRA